MFFRVEYRLYSDKKEDSKRVVEVHGVSSDDEAAKKFYKEFPSACAVSAKHKFDHATDKSVARI